MFRKKESDPIRPSGLSETGADSPLARPAEVGRSGAGPSRGPAEFPVTGQMSGHLPAGADRAAEGKRLIVGQGISLAGEITACDRLVVQGSVQVTLNETKAIEITETGRFTNGKAEVEEAEISGLYEGELTVRNRLLIRSTGQVRGTVRYGELELERGGRISGSISMLDHTGKEIGGEPPREAA